MMKDMKWNLLFGFIVGLMLGWWWSKGNVVAMILVGLIGSVFGYIETMVARKRAKNIADGKVVRWWQRRMVVICIIIFMVMLVLMCYVAYIVF